MIKSFNMATMPERIESCIQSIESIYDQADIIRLYLNNFNKIPPEYVDDKIIIHQGEDLKSSGKLFWANNENEYYFCIDDDIYYPKTYADDMINKLNEYDDDIILSLHGKIFKDGKINSYFKDVKYNYHFRLEVLNDVFVDVIGNGVSLFNTNKLKIDWKTFKYLHMDDIMISLEALKQNKRRLVMKHDNNYLKSIKNDNITLYDIYRNNDGTQTEMVNSVKWR